MRISGWATDRLCLGSSFFVVRDAAITGILVLLIGERNIVMNVSVSVCVCLCLSVRDHIFETARPFFCPC